MERTGASASAVSSADLVDVAEKSGPFLSVYLTTEVAVDNAAQLSDRRWKTVRRHLADAGAPERCLEVVDGVVPGAHLEGAALGVVVAVASRGRGTARRSGSAGTEAPFVDHDVEPLAGDLASFGSVPVLTPSIAWRQHEPPYVTVVADRTGADLLAVTREAPPEERRGGDAQWPVSKAGGGGHGYRRYQHRVEEVWARNERRVATELERLVDAIGARLVAVAGDERAVGLLREAVPDRLGDMVVTVGGSRAAEGVQDGLGDEVAHLVHSVEARDTVEALEALGGGLSSGRAVQGKEATFDALREARVDVLLVHDSRLTARDELTDGARGASGAFSEPSAWFDPTTPELCALDRAELEALGVEKPAEGGLVDIAVRAALLSDARVRLVPAHGGPDEGIGALLRWSA